MNRTRAHFARIAIFAGLFLPVALACAGDPDPEWAEAGLNSDERESVDALTFEEAALRYSECPEFLEQRSEDDLSLGIYYRCEGLIKRGSIKAGDGSDADDSSDDTAVDDAVDTAVDSSAPTAESTPMDSAAPLGAEAPTTSKPRTAPSASSSTSTTSTTTTTTSTLPPTTARPTTTAAAPGDSAPGY